MIGVGDALFIELLEHQKSTFHQRLLTKDGEVDLHSHFVNIVRYIFGARISQTIYSICQNFGAEFFVVFKV